MLVGRQDARGLPEVEDKDRVERLVRFNMQYALIFRNTIGHAVRRHVV
jgi:hypothetical protein